MSSTVKDFIPPIIYRKLESLKKDNTLKTFKSYQEALQSCPNDAYEEQELIEVIFKKTQRYIQKIQSDITPIAETASYSLAALLNPIITNQAKYIRVLDFGGACGAHYFQLRNLIDKSLKINWVVVETPTMVSFAKALETEELSFCTNFADALKKLGTIDLLHTSGTLQCVDDPQKYLAEILNCNAKWVLFNRLGLNKIDRDAITIHSSKLSWNGVGELPPGHTDRWVRYPFTFMPEKVFLEKIQTQYQLVAQTLDTSGMYPIKGEDIVGYGLLCKHKT